MLHFVTRCVLGTSIFSYLGFVEWCFGCRIGEEWSQWAFLPLKYLFRGWRARISSAIVEVLWARFAEVLWASCPGSARTKIYNNYIRRQWLALMWTYNSKNKIKSSKNGFRLKERQQLCFICGENGLMLYAIKYIDR